MTHPHGVTRSRLLGKCEDIAAKLRAELSRPNAADELARAVDDLNARRPDVDRTAQSAVANAIGQGGGL